MKKVLLLFLLFAGFKGYSQDKSIFEYYSLKGSKVDSEKAFFIEKLTQIGDSLWEIKRFRKSGKLINVRFSLTKKKKQFIGQSITYNDKDSISAIMFFNKKGEKHGRYLSWFDDQSKSIEGIFQHNKKEGLWKYYHSNGKIASRGIYKNDSIIRGTYFDEQGNKIPHNLDHCKKEMSFLNGKQKFHDKLQYIVYDLKSLQGKKIHVNFMVNANGDITNVYTDELLPINITNKIVNYFEGIKGFSPAIKNHRRVATKSSIILNINKGKLK